MKRAAYVWWCSNAGSAFEEGRQLRGQRLRLSSKLEFGAAWSEDSLRCRGVSPCCVVKIKVGAAKLAELGSVRSRVGESALMFFRPFRKPNKAPEPTSTSSRLVLFHVTPKEEFVQNSFSCTSRAAAAVAHL